jgi:DNA-binding GntR family transcriptional regulator
MAAIAAKNGPLAAQQMRAHIESGERSLLDQLASEEAEAGA